MSGHIFIIRALNMFLRYQSPKYVFAFLEEEMKTGKFS